mgnify:CR=1 FL=1
MPQEGRDRRYLKTPFRRHVDTQMGWSDDPNAWRDSLGDVLALADVACFSFYPTKNLGCFGDGGLLTTHDTKLAERLKLLRGHGMQPRYYHQALGINSRLDELQAAVLRARLPRLAAQTARRRAIAAEYRRDDARLRGHGDALQHVAQAVVAVKVADLEHANGLRNRRSARPCSRAPLAVAPPPACAPDAGR